MHVASLTTSSRLDVTECTKAELDSAHDTCSHSRRIAVRSSATIGKSLLFPSTAALSIIATIRSTVASTLLTELVIVRPTDFGDCSLLIGRSMILQLMDRDTIQRRPIA